MHAIVVAVDALHLGYLGCYGGEWIETPNLNHLANDAFVFDQCFATNSTLFGSLGATFQSLPTTLFGDESHNLGVPEERVFPLKAALSDGRVNGAIFRYDRHHPVGPGRSAFGFGHARNQLGDWSASLAAIFSQSAEWAERNRQRDSLVWINFSIGASDPLLALPIAGVYHHDLAVPFPAGSLPAWDTTDAGFVSLALSNESTPATADEAALLGMDAASIYETILAKIRNAFGAAVTQFDARFGEFIADLARRKMLDDRVIILTADQSVPLGEHGFVGTSFIDLVEERTHIPLIVRDPAGRRGARSLALVQSIDIGATLGECLGLEAGEPGGKSILPIVRGGATTLRDFQCIGLENGLFSIRTRTWNLVLSIPSGPDDPEVPLRKLFAKPEDRWDVHDVAEQHPDIADALELQLRRYLEAARRGTPDRVQPMRDDRLIAGV